MFLFVELLIMPLTYSTSNTNSSRTNQPIVYSDDGIILPSRSTDSTVDVRIEEYKAPEHASGRDTSVAESRNILQQHQPRSTSLPVERLSNPFRKTSPSPFTSPSQQQTSLSSSSPPVSSTPAIVIATPSTAEGVVDAESLSWRNKDVVEESTSIFRASERSAVVAAADEEDMEAMWTIKRCYAFDEDDDEEEQYDDRINKRRLTFPVVEFES